MTKELGLFVIDDQLITVDWCPKRFYHKYIADDYPYTESTGAPSPMEIGLYGESHLLGGSARGMTTTDLRLKKNGTKYIDHDRVDIQLQRMYGYMYAMGARWGVHNVQVPLIAKYRDNVWIRGEYDVFPTMFNGELSIIDTKFTKDVENIFSSTSEKNIRHATISCWGDYDNLQKNQALFYHFIARNFKAVGVENMIKYKPDKAAIYQYLFSQKHDYENINFIFMVAGYGVRDLTHQLKHFEYRMDRRRHILFEYLVDMSIERVNDGMKNKFEANKKTHLCKKCEMRNVCLG
jgi:hypothetical protein